MVATGSPIDTVVLTFSSADWRHRQKLEASKPFDDFVQGLTKTLNALKNVGKSGDLDLIIKVEASLITLECSLYGQKDPSVLPSLNAAITDFTDIKSAIEVVKSPEAYKSAASTYRAKKKLHGIVIDGCHEAINGHVTRLGNRMSAVGISVPEKNILRQRRENMKVAKELYIELQRKALGLSE